MFLANKYGAGGGGFTLIELVTVMVLTGILAIAVLPRFFDQATFNSRGFNDETLSILRYAQKTAVAQRRTVCAAFTATSVTLTIASAAATSSCNTNLTGPKGETPATITAKSGITYAALPSNFNFDGLGQPSVTQTIQVTGAANHVVVEAGTGYVHE